jgi:hypothetical protein
VGGDQRRSRRGARHRPRDLARPTPAQRMPDRGRGRGTGLDHRGTRRRPCRGTATRRSLRVVYVHPRYETRMVCTGRMSSTRSVPDSGPLPSESGRSWRFGADSRRSHTSGAGIRRVWAPVEAGQSNSCVGRMDPRQAWIK